MKTKTRRRYPPPNIYSNTLAAMPERPEAAAAWLKEHWIEIEGALRLADLSFQTISGRSVWTAEDTRPPGRKPARLIDLLSGRAALS